MSSDLPEGFGGNPSSTGANWSVASMVNMSSGLPMKVPVGANAAYGSADNFLPGATTIGDILKEQGYNQTVMFGADASFGGLDYFFEEHGDYKIMDHKRAKEDNFIPQDYSVWWGYEDDKLYEYAKMELTRWQAKTNLSISLWKRLIRTSRTATFLPMPRLRLISSMQT